MLHVIFAAASALFVHSPAASAFAFGQLSAVNKVSDVQWTYTITAGTSSYTGQSTQPLRLMPNERVTFALKGKNIFVVDDYGEMKHILNSAAAH